MAKQVRKKKDKDKQPEAKVVTMHRYEDAGNEKLTLLQQAVWAEKNDDLKTAERLYRQLIKQKAFSAPVYTRLMIIYRKQKKYKEELEIINKALQHFKEDDAKRTASKASNAIITKLSKSLNKSLGLTDKKGNQVYEPEPVATWKKRKITAEKKLKK